MLSTCNKIILLPILVFIFTSCGSSEPTADNSVYDVTSKSNVSRVRVSRAGSTENRIEIIIRGRSQMTSSGPENVLLQGSSGVEENSSYLGFDTVSFPFKGSVAFDYSKQKNDVVGSAASNVEAIGSTVRASVRFAITEPGHWRVNIYY